MKKIAVLFVAFIAVLTSCEGPEGPVGPPGEPGPQTIGETFEYVVDFTPANDYSFIAEFDPALYDGDIMLVYHLEAVDGGTDIWEPLPTAQYYNEETGDNLLYRNNFSNYDVEILVESSNFAAFGPEFYTGQVFRVVIIPSELIGKVDVSNIEEVMKAANIKSVQTML